MSYVCIGNRENDLKFCWFGYVSPVTLFMLGQNKPSCLTLLRCELWIRFSSLILLYNNWGPEPIQILYIPNKLLYGSKYQAISVSFLACQANTEDVVLQWSKICFREGSAQGIFPIYKIGYFLTPLIQLYSVQLFCAMKVRDYRQQGQGEECHTFQLLCGINGSGNTVALCPLCAFFSSKFHLEIWGIMQLIIIIKESLLIYINHGIRKYAFLEKMSLFPLVGALPGG